MDLGILEKSIRAIVRDEVNLALRYGLTVQLNTEPAQLTPFSAKNDIKSKVFLSTNERREVAWLLANTNLKKEEIAARYGIHPTTLNKHSMGRTKTWNKALKNPKQPDWYTKPNYDAVPHHR